MNADMDIGMCSTPSAQNVDGQPVLGVSSEGREHTNGQEPSDDSYHFVCLLKAQRRQPLNHEHSTSQDPNGDWSSGQEAGWCR